MQTKSTYKVIAATKVLEGCRIFGTCIATTYYRMKHRICQTFTGTTKRKTGPKHRKRSHIHTHTHLHRLEGDARHPTPTPSPSAPRRATKEIFCEIVVRLLYAVALTQAPLFRRLSELQSRFQFRLSRTQTENERAARWCGGGGRGGER